MKIISSKKYFPCVDMLRAAVILTAIHFGIHNTNAQISTWNWVQTASGSRPWETPGNWSPATIPNEAGSHVIINNTPGGNQTINTGTSFKSLGRLDLGAASGSASYTLSAGTGGGLNFTSFDGGNAQINQVATSNANTISAPLTLSSSLDIANASASLLTFSTGGITAATTGLKTLTTSTGAVTVSGVIGNGAGSMAVVHDGPGTLVLSGANTFTGGFTLNDGIFILGHNESFGGAGNVVTINGGTLDTTGSRTIANAYDYRWNGSFALGGTSNINFGAGNILLGADVRLTAPVARTYTIGGVISDAGADRGLALSGAATLVLTGANTYGGATSVEGGTLTLNAGGSILNSSDIRVRQGTLMLDNSSTITQRLGSNATLTLQGGSFELRSGTVTGFTQSLENIALNAGGNTFYFRQPLTGGKKITLQADSLTRENRATALIRGASIGGAGAENTSIRFATTPANLIGGGGADGTQTISIIPWLVGESNQNNSIPGTQFFTYSYDTGTDEYVLRTLDASEYLTASGAAPMLDLSSVDPAINARLSIQTGATNTGIITGGTVNSLTLLQSGSTGYGYALTGTVTINSGALLVGRSGANPYATSIDGGVIQFAGSDSPTSRKEGIITVSLGAELTINSQISGSGGVTFSTYNDGSAIVLNSSNSYTGTTTVNGAVIVAAEGALPGTSAVTIAPGGSLTLNVDHAVASGASLGGAGTLHLGDTHTLTVESGGVLAPGADNFGTLLLERGGNTASTLVTAESGARFHFTLGANLESSRFSLTGGLGDDVAFNGNAVDFTDLAGGTLSLGAYQLFTADTAGVWAGLTLNEEGYILNGLSIGDGLSSYTANLQWVDNDLFLNITSVVPEPSIWALLGFAATLLALRPRRRATA